ncbi:MAG: alpha/beta fold hydrolase [Pseudomonadota bacterium]
MPRSKKRPPRSNLLAEALVGFQAASVPAALLRARVMGKRSMPRRPVIVLPGFAASDWSTAPLRAYLDQHGYRAEGWGLGRNTGGRGLVESVSDVSQRWEFDRERAQPIDVEVPALCDLFFQRLEERAEAHGGPVSLVGWSLGGYVAREAARELPEHVVQVVTLGSPVNGGPKYTSIAPLFRFRGVNLDLIEETIEARNTKKIRVPITAIYGARDGIVSEYAAIDTASPYVRHERVSASHFGMGLNSKVWELVRRALEDGDRLSASTSPSAAS